MSFCADRPRPTFLARQRMAWRIARAKVPVEVAPEDDTATRLLSELLEQPAFAALIEACAALQGMPEDERIAHLAHLAHQAIERAVLSGDVRVAVFVLHHEACETGLRDPALVVAQGVLRSYSRRHPPSAGRPQPRAATWQHRLGLADVLFHSTPERLDRPIRLRAAAALRREVMSELERRALARRLHRPRSPERRSSPPTRWPLPANLRASRPQRSCEATLPPRARSP